MKREDLQKIEGLSKEQMDSILGLHQDDVIIWKGKITTLEEKKTNLEGDLKKFDGVDVEGLQKRITTLEQDKSTLETEKADLVTKHGEALSKVVFDGVLDKAIFDTKTIDPIGFKAHLDMDKISYDSESKALTGFDEQAESIKKELGHYFPTSNTGKEHGRMNTDNQEVSLASALQEKYQ